MNVILSAILLGISLCADCFAVALCSSVTVTRVSGSWAYVTYRGGEGWVSTSYLG